MTNEKLNSDTWKAKLEDADALQEYALQNKNAAWESLYDKLHKKQQPKFSRYWMAAACLIAIIAVVLFTQHPANNNDTVIHTSRKTQPQQNTVSQQPSQQSAIQKKQ